MANNKKKRSYNPINIIQKWMDTLAGQTFMNYAYSWGAAVVILGTLFKLTHIQGANTMLFIGMGTEVFVFIISGFERVTEKPSEAEQSVVGGQQVIVAGGGIPAQGENFEGTPLTDGETPVVAPVASGPIVIGGGAPVVAGGPVDPNAAGLSAVAANLAAAGQAAAEAQLAMSQLNGGNAGTVDANAIKATDPAEIEEAVRNYAEELKELTEVLARVKTQTSKMGTDSEEMENLDRTLTGIATIYELQLKTISKQVVTIEHIDEQTRKMAAQMEELNKVYARMIEALTVNMNVAAAAPVKPE